MSVLVVGLSHKSAPVPTLERAVVTGDTLGKLLRDVFHADGVAGSLVSYYVAYMSHIGFMWPSTLGFGATLVVGVLWSLVVPGRPNADALRLTWWSVMASPERRPAEARIPTPRAGA